MSATSNKPTANQTEGQHKNLKIKHIFKETAHILSHFLHI